MASVGKFETENKIEQAEKKDEFIVFVGNLDAKVTEASLTAFFQTHDVAV